jgi:hypothetical protein
MSDHAYRVYGLRIHTEIACPGLPPDPQPDAQPDVAIRLLPPVSAAAQPLENGYYEVRPGAFRLLVKGVARYLVEEGSRISVEPFEGSSPDEVRLFLMGSVIGALLYQRGLFPLHGSAVETRWGAMIFVGAQGAGKSTLAAQFHRRGYRLLSDDVCAVAPREGAFEVLPAHSQFRLCADAYERLDSPQDARFHVDKFVVPMNEGYCTDAAPLKAIHILADKPEGGPQFEVLRGFNRVQSLLENLYRPQFLKGQETQGDLMRLAAGIAQKADVVTVSRKRDPEAIDGLIDFLEAAWEKHFGPMAQAMKSTLQEVKM